MVDGAQHKHKILRGLRSLDDSRAEDTEALMTLAVVLGAWRFQLRDEEKESRRRTGPERPKEREKRRITNHALTKHESRIKKFVPVTLATHESRITMLEGNQNHRESQFDVVN